MNDTVNRRTIWSVACALILATVLGEPALAAPPDQPPLKSKSRRVVVLGTTIVGEALTPPVDRTVPWRNPTKDHLNAAPAQHDFSQELLKPLDRERILREAQPHEP